jgi:malate synthase
MIDRIEKFGLRVARPLHDMIEFEALPATGVPSDTFWRGLSDLVHGFGPRNRALLANGATTCRRRSTPGTGCTAAAARRRGLQGLPAGDRLPGPRRPGLRDRDRQRRPRDRSIAGPQLVVPVMNARYALNAANARWGSLYDALYGTDAMGDLPRRRAGYDAARGAR